MQSSTAFGAHGSRQPTRYMATTASAAYPGLLDDRITVLGSPSATTPGREVRVLLGRAWGNSPRGGDPAAVGLALPMRLLTVLGAALGAAQLLDP